MPGPVGDDGGERAGAGASLADQGLDAGAGHGVQCGIRGGEQPGERDQQRGDDDQGSRGSRVHRIAGQESSSPTVPSSRESWRR